MGINSGTFGTDEFFPTHEPQKVWSSNLYQGRQETSHVGEFADELYEFSPISMSRIPSSAELKVCMASPKDVGHSIGEGSVVRLCGSTYL